MTPSLATSASPGNLLTECHPRHIISAMNPFSKGDWIQWSTEFAVKRGEVIFSRGPSIIVRWLGGAEQVFPVIEGYVAGPYAASSRMVHIPRPKEATRIERESRKGIMSVQRAAASLGTTPKRVRAMLRSGQLQGQQNDEGKWVSVEL